MEYKNDERYWNIKLLNKWFLIAALLWTVSMIWMFIDDNDDEFKYYQKEYYSILKDKTEKKYNVLYSEVSNLKIELENELASKKKSLKLKQNKIDDLNNSIRHYEDKYAKINIEFKSAIVEVDVAKYLVEKEKASHGYSEQSTATLNFIELTKEKNRIKKQKEDIEIAILDYNNQLDDLNKEVKLAQDKRDQELIRLDLLEKQLTKLDRNRMTLGNQIADIFRDLPIVDFLDPKLKVQQTVVTDVKYDVNFAKVPIVDRCVSCHMGIEDSEFLGDIQPYAAHSNLDLIGSSSSPHPFNEFGCTSCHAGRSRGTEFTSSAHMPHTKDQQKEWKEEHDWHIMHHWLQPMLPSEYSQAGCYKCHTKQPYLKGADKLQLGISLIHKKGCNACHLIESMPSDYDIGPDLTKINQKLDKDWVFKWIRNPQSFRYDTHMPHFFQQDNNSSPNMIARNEAEVYAITEFLYKNKQNYKANNSNQFLGDIESGAKLFSAVGCMGCHQINESSITYQPGTEEYEFYLSEHGYSNLEITNYNLLNQQGPNLIGLGSKLSSEWLYNWLKNPKNYWKKTRMPDLRLSDQEAKDITAYLLSFKNADFDNQALPNLNDEFFSSELEFYNYG